MAGHRHLRSFVKGATGGHAAGGGAGRAEVVPTPSEVMAKATAMLHRILAVQFVWFLMFCTGVVLALWSAWENGHETRCVVSSVPAGGTVAATCGQQHAYWLPIVLMLFGIGALLVTGYVATRLAVRYLGAGAAALLQGAGRRSRWAPGAGRQRPGGSDAIGGPVGSPPGGLPADPGRVSGG